MQERLMWMERRGGNLMKTGSILTMSLAASLALMGQTVQQAEAGRAAYQAQCSGCHGTDLGGNEGPQLAGSNFVAAWGSRVERELVTTIRTTMPPARAGQLSEEAAVNIAAFILAAN